MMRPEAFCRVQAMMENIRCDDIRSAGDPRQLYDQQPDRPAAKYPDGHPRFELSQIYCMDGHTERLEHCSVGIGERIGNWEKTFFRPGDAFPQSPILLFVPGKDNK